MLEQPHNTNYTCRNIPALQEVNPKLPLGLKMGTQSTDVGPLQCHSLNLKRNNWAQTLLWHCAGNTCLIWLKTPGTHQWLIYGKLWNLLHPHKKLIYFYKSKQDFNSSRTLGGKRPHNDSKPCELQFLKVIIIKALFPVLVFKVKCLGTGLKAALVICHQVTLIVKGESKIW